ncbi:rhomboid family intramembrane serine protease [Bacteriovorax sp. BAL6_X]|uniref:rhomboid family intramembrane serine protease n=1 Tax=Bacteriovorax sp. BAL6_X TaxID=1201290 RepID=UPI0006988824|nr:rhomboid family intramembrane serine protease [Bacteriovorax sp. BAL6_X]
MSEHDSEINLKRLKYIGSLRDESIVAQIEAQLIRQGVHITKEYENDFYHLFVVDLNQLQQARDVYRVYIGGAKPTKVDKNWQYVQSLNMGPTTIIILALCVIIFIFGWILKNENLYYLFLFSTSKVDAFADINNGEYWRLLSPAFIHFGYIHIFFNMLWWKELGKLIEVTKGSVFLILLLLFTAISSNILQAIMSPGMFGGLSGVVYGLLGFLWPYSRLNPNFKFKLPTSDIVLMVGWLFLGFFDVFNFKMANWAHGGGLVSGAILGVIFALIDRSDQKSNTHQS